MDETIPWSDWVEMIRPHYNNELGRDTKNIEVMLRMYLLQNWYNLSDENAEEEIIEGYSFRKFVE
ncbi:MAG: transposase [Bdellovibrionota bacterium]